MTLDKMNSDSNMHNQAGLAVDMIVKTSLARRALDNITCVFIGFDNWEKIIDKRRGSFIKQIDNSLNISKNNSNNNKNKNYEDINKSNSNTNRLGSSNVNNSLNKKIKSSYNDFRSASSGKKLRNIA